MEVLLYLGCTVPVRNLNYELSARLTASALGITFRDLNSFGCCGFPLKSLNSEDTLVIAARNLALAEREGMEICALCNACTGTLTEAAHLLESRPELKEQVNKRLKSVDLRYEGPVRVRHYMRLLWEEIGVDGIRSAITRPLSGATLAPHYGCHYLKPSELTVGFDSPEVPRTLSELISATGAQALVLVCPFCNVMYEGQQKKIVKKAGLDLKVPVVYYPQVLGLALGLSSDELGFKLNRVKPTQLLQTVEG